VSNKETEQFVMITKTVLDSKAYRAMSMGARVLYTALKRRYWRDRKNNGRIYLSQRDAAKEIGRDTNQITRWFRELQHYGFIVQTKRGSLGSDGVGKAPHWRLTEVGFMKEHPTQDFLHWGGAPFRDTVAPSQRKPKAKFGTAFCESCGVEFKRKRKDAKYCSGDCRQKAFRERNRKQIPVRETTDTYVRETTDTIVLENTDSETDNRPGKLGHMSRISVRESTDISGIPSLSADGLPWSTPRLTELTVTPAEFAALSRLPDVPKVHMTRRFLESTHALTTSSIH
jgi:hypothetical protein